MIIKLKGGLGNQLFQYAYGRSLELSGKNVIFDISFFEGEKSKRDVARNFKLDKFNIETKAPFKIASDNKILNKILITFGIKDEFHQSEKYFKSIESQIKKEFTLKNPLSFPSASWKEKIGNAENSVSLHIRRGDYVENKITNEYHGSLEADYYEKALEKIGGNPEIFVFSDDITWAKENLKFPYPTNFVSDLGIPDYEEMCLMSLCKNNIIANSTFSWWSAWLNNYKDKIVIAPKFWFKNKTGKNIVPKTWIRI